MSKLFKLLGLVMVITAILLISVVGTGCDCNSRSTGPAPNSGDGISDGSGL